MKKQFTPVFGLLAAVALGTMSCSDKNENPLPEETKLPAPSVAGFAKLRADVLADLTITKAFKVEDGITFTTGKNTKVSISPNCLMRANGDPATGDVELSFVEIYDQSDMVLANKPLMGRNAEGKLQPLVTAGQFFLEVKQGGEVLKPGCGYQVVIPASLTGAVDSDMILWEGSIDNNGDLTWDSLSTDQERGFLEVGKAEGENGVYDAYYSWRNQFGWTNLDRFYHYQGEKTPIRVYAPETYKDPRIVSIYLSFEGEPNLLSQVYYDNASKAFTTGGSYEIPTGKNTHVILVTESDGKFAYAIKTVNVKADQEVTFEHKDLATISNEDLAAKIKALK